MIQLDSPIEMFGITGLSRLRSYGFEILRRSAERMKRKREEADNLSECAKAEQTIRIKNVFEK